MTVPHGLAVLTAQKEHEISRGSVLEAAAQCTLKDRNSVYGEPYPNLNCMAKLVNAHIETKYGNLPSLTAEDMAIIMTLGKIARMSAGKFKDDNFVDGAAYLAIAAECAVMEDIAIKPAFSGAANAASA